MLGSVKGPEVKIRRLNEPCFLPPATEVWEGYVFTPVCHSVHRGRGVCMAGGGGHVWQGGMVGGMCGRGACVVGAMHGGGPCMAGACVAGRHAWQGAYMARMPPEVTTIYGQYRTHPTVMHSCFCFVLGLFFVSKMFEHIFLHFQFSHRFQCRHYLAPRFP